MEPEELPTWGRKRQNKGGTSLNGPPPFPRLQWPPLLTKPQPSARHCAMSERVSACVFRACDLRVCMWCFGGPAAHYCSESRFHTCGITSSQVGGDRKEKRMLGDVFESGMCASRSCAYYPTPRYTTPCLRSFLSHTFRSYPSSPHSSPLLLIISLLLLLLVLLLLLRLLSLLSTPARSVPLCRVGASGQPAAPWIPLRLGFQKKYMYHSTRLRKCAHKPSRRKGDPPKRKQA